MIVAPRMEMELRLVGDLPPRVEKEERPPPRKIDGEFNRQWVDENGEPTF